MANKLNERMAKIEQKVDDLCEHNGAAHNAIFKKLENMDKKLIPKWRVELLEKVVYGGLGMVLLAVLYKLLQVINLQ